VGSAERKKPADEREVVDVMNLNGAEIFAQVIYRQ